MCVWSSDLKVIFLVPFPKTEKMKQYMSNVED
jgi:hypothetical protein